MLQSLNSGFVCRPIQTGETPAPSTFMMVPEAFQVILNVHGYDEIRMDRVPGEAGTVHVYMTPLENQ